MTTPQLPPCGCRTGCEHMRNPQFPAQRECRAGPMPDPIPPDDVIVRPCALDDPHGPHLRMNGKHCPGLEEFDEFAGEVAQESASRTRWRAWCGLRTPARPGDGSGGPDRG